MRRSVAAVAFLVMAAACGGSSSCATLGGTTPSKTWANQREALTAMNNAFIAASTANRLDDTQRVYYGELLQAARSSLTQAQALLPAGGSTFDSYMGIVQAILVKAADLQAKGGQ